MALNVSLHIFEVDVVGEWKNSFVHVKIRGGVFPYLRTGPTYFVLPSSNAPSIMQVSEVQT